MAKDGKISWRTNRMGKHDLDDILMPYFIAKNRLVRMAPENIFSWNGNFRGLSKDFEFLLESSQAMLYLVSIKLF